MKNIIDFIKDKSYYFLGGTVVLIVLLIIINACSSSVGSYSKIESKMVVAAQNYYSQRQNKLSKSENGTAKVTIQTLIEHELLKEVTDPNDKNNSCTGYVEVTKIGKDYSYIPFLTCKGNYEPEYLKDKVKKVKTDEYGNGVYEINEEYVYRGEDVNNYVSFNDQVWRIIKVDNEGNTKLILNDTLEDLYSWDSSYNSDKEDAVGITTDYLHTNIRKTLNDYYKNNFTSDNKAKIATVNLCVGKYDINTDDYGSSGDNFSTEKECSSIKENEKVGLLNATDIQNASLDDGCTNLFKNECVNRNYLNSDVIFTWLLNTSSNDSYTVLYYDGTINYSKAVNEHRVNPVIYLNNNVITLEGKGTESNPYIIK